MYFFVVFREKKGFVLLNRFFNWESFFFFNQLLNQQCILQSSSNGGYFFYTYLQQGSDPNKSNSPDNEETDTMWIVVKEINWNLAIKLSIQFKPCWL